MKPSIYSKQHREMIERLKKARLDCGLDQQKTARLLGTTQSYISKLESGQRRIDVLQLRELARIYKKSASYFFK